MEMACSHKSCFDICLKIMVNTRTGRAETEVQCDEVCPGLEFEFEDGIIIITIPLVACVETTLRDSLRADAQLVSLSLPGYS